MDTRTSVAVTCSREFIDQCGGHFVHLNLIKYQREEPATVDEIETIKLFASQQQRVPIRRRGIPGREGYLLAIYLIKVCIEPSAGVGVAVAMGSEFQEKYPVLVVCVMWRWVYVEEM